MKKNIKKIKIGHHVIIGDLIEQHPEAAMFLITEYGINCVNCFAAGFDTLKQGARIHGIIGEDFEELISELESYLEEQKSIENEESSIIN